MSRLTEQECDCGRDGDYYAYIDGMIYGPCDDEQCTGVCADRGICTCSCHGDEW